MSVGVGEVLVAIRNNDLEGLQVQATIAIVGPTPWLTTSASTFITRVYVHAHELRHNLDKRICWNSLPCREGFLPK